MSSDLHIKYRPSNLDEVVGHESVINSLATVLENPGERPHAFLFTGGSGVGKTTLARIIGNMVDARILEVDGATSTGIDSMNKIKEGAALYGLGRSVHKLIIIDECHMLSKSAWNALLSILEQPPAHVYFVLCTTEIKKVPPAVKTRCHTYDLKPVRSADIRDLVDYVCIEEGIELKSSILSKIVEESKGSPRQALVYLSMCRACDDLDEVQILVQSVSNKDDNAISLCRLLCGTDQQSWSKYLVILNNLKDGADDESASAEGLRLTVLNYATKTLLNAKKEARACHLLNVMRAFSEPYNGYEKFAPLVMSVAECYFAEI